MKKIGLFFGGMSNEHDVSIMSAKNVDKYIDRDLFELVLIYRSRDWVFFIVENINDLDSRQKIPLNGLKKIFDVALLMTHGKNWEDWVLQWMLESQKIPYCGCRVLSSALCMDKAVFREILSKYWLKQTKYKLLDYKKHKEDEIQKIKNESIIDLKFPLYIKPANSWSSVGIIKVDSLDWVDFAIQEALKHDFKVLIEEWIVWSKEIELAILGNKDIFVSDPGELVLVKEFYDYDDKYKLGQTKMKIPADIDNKIVDKIKKISEFVYKIFDCQWFARIDFFVKWDEIYLNEINTLPGFTDISMFPMLMKNMGVEYKELITKIIELGY